MGEGGLKVRILPHESYRGHEIELRADIRDDGRATATFKAYENGAFVVAGHAACGSSSEEEAKQIGHQAALAAIDCKLERAIGPTTQQ